MISVISHQSDETSNNNIDDKINGYYWEDNVGNNVDI
jgi:hypothetical protein